jgi:hypothetical protein
VIIESRARLARMALLALAVSALPVTLLGLRPYAVARGGAGGVQGSIFRIPEDSVSEAVRHARRVAALSHDPFRRSRTAPALSYNAAAIDRAQHLAVAPPLPKPVLVLTGILWGNRPAALLEGIPGQEGARLFRLGDTAGGIRLRSLTRTRALLVGFDTSWALVVREPWK